MSKKVKIILGAIVIIFLLFISVRVFAVYFAQDTVFLYENGKRITDNVICRSDRCENGVCKIGQQFYPVTLHRVKNNGILTGQEYDVKYPYKGPNYGSARGEAIDKWNAENSKNYLKYLEENSYYSTSFDPGKSSESTQRNRFGNPRSFDLDFKTGKYKQTGEEITPKIFTFPTFFYFLIGFVGFIGLVLLIIGIIYLIKSQRISIQDKNIKNKYYKKGWRWILFGFILIIVGVSFYAVIYFIFSGIVG